MNNEEALWTCVITQAVEDGCRSKSKNIRTKARNWFRLPNRPFIQVCDLAGLSPVKVSVAATRLFSQMDKGVDAFTPLQGALRWLRSNTRRIE